MLKKTILFAVVAGLVLALAPAAMAGPLVTGGLVGYWGFDAEDATDDSGNGHTGTESGTVAYKTDDVPTNGGAASLDLTGGGSIGITGGSEDDFDTEAQSIAFWTKGEPQGDWGIWITKDTGFRINQRASGKTEMNYYIWGDGEARFGIDHSDNLWHHYAMTYDSSGVNSGTKKVYHNGVEIKTEAGKDPPANLRVLSFGDRDSNDAAGYQPAGGTSRTRVQMDEIYFFSRALTEDEVQKLYVPEPATLALLGVGGLGMLLRRRSR